MNLNKFQDKFLQLHRQKYLSVFSVKTKASLNDVIDEIREISGSQIHYHCSSKPKSQIATSDLSFFVLIKYRDTNMVTQINTNSIFCLNTMNQMEEYLNIGQLDPNKLIAHAIEEGEVTKKAVLKNNLIGMFFFNYWKSIPVADKNIQ
ncbi:hypothetical protein OAO55_01515 [Bacteroidales bacterium]|nr:hypothetical protein [Bacteroidales bacterium]